MTITVNPVNFNISKDLITRVESIFENVDKYNDQLVGLDIYLKSLSETDSGEKMVEVKIFLPSLLASTNVGSTDKVAYKHIS